MPLLTLALAALALGACTARAPQPIDSESDAATRRGLRRAWSDGEQVVYVVPGAHLDRYSEVLVDPFMISYTTEPRPAGSEPQPIRTLDRETEAKLAGAMREAFVKSLKRSRHFSVVETLILTVRSAQTAQALALVAHRLATRCERRQFLDALRWDDVTRALQPWAVILRDHLDSLHDIEETSGRAPAR
jgi:hypothetical protein